MKKLFTFFFLTILISNSYAQECMNYYYLADNSEVEMTTYDRKGKQNGKVIYKVKDVKKDGEAFTSVLHSTILDDKNKTVSSSEGKFKCDGAKLEMDMRMTINSEQMSAYKDMNVKADEAYLAYPSKVEPGQTLPDGKFKMEVENNGAPFSTIVYDVVNRKVQGKESITTPAGTWDCYKIAYDGQMNVRTMGIGVPMNMKIVEWYCPGFGVVKTESYSKNDKLMGSTVLTSIKK